MFLQLLAALEGLGELADDLVLLGRELVGVFPVHGGEIGVGQVIFDVPNGDAFVRIVDLVQQQPVIHAEAGIPGGQRFVLLCVLLGVVSGEFGGKAGAVAILVDLIGKKGQRPQRNAVTGLDDLQIVVVDGVGEYGGHQCAAPGGGSHPQHIVVAPLDVHGVVIHEGVHNDVRPGSAVEHIAHHVEPVHHHALDEIAHGHDKVLRPIDVDDGGDDVFVVVPLVVKLVIGVEQFVDDIGKIVGQRLAHLGAGIFGGDQTADVNKAVKGDPVPLVPVLELSGEFGELFRRIVNECGELIALRPGNTGGKERVHLFPHHARGGVENMEEGLIFSVNVGNKVLGTLGQVQDGLEVDDLAAGRLYRGVLAGEHLQIAQIWGGAGLFGIHPQDPPYGLHGCCYCITECGERHDKFCTFCAKIVSKHRANKYFSNEM